MQFKNFLGEKELKHVAILILLDSVVQCEYVDLYINIPKVAILILLDSVVQCVKMLFKFI